MNVTQQCRCSPMLIFRAWSTCDGSSVCEKRSDWFGVYYEHRKLWILSFSSYKSSGESLLPWRWLEDRAKKRITSQTTPTDFENELGLFQEFSLKPHQGLARILRKKLRFDWTVLIASGVLFTTSSAITISISIAIIFSIIAKCAKIQTGQRVNCCCSTLKVATVHQ